MAGLFAEKKKFILTIGDDGAILAYLNGTKVLNRIFAPSSSESDRAEINSLLTRYSSVPIYVMLDTMEQSYTKQALPAVSSFSIGKLVKKRLERDFAETDIKGAIPLGREKTGRKDWLYMFASTPVNAEISQWINYIISLPNKFSGIYMLPAETENLAKNISNILYKNNKSKPKWQFFVLHNKVGGFRQVILKEGKVIFTRMIRHGKDNLPDIMAGNIEQEIVNTMDYLRRLSYDDNEPIDVVVIVSQDIKKSLVNSKINNHPISAYTPHEICTLLGFKDASTYEDKFSDIVGDVNFAVSKPILKLTNPATSSIISLTSLYNWSFKAMIVITPLIILYNGYIGYNIIDTNSRISSIENEKASIDQKWKEAQKTDEYNIDEANKITNVVSLIEVLKSETNNPLQDIKNMGLSEENYALTKSLNWHSTDSSDPNENSGQNNQYTALFNIDFNNSSGSIEQLFSDFDNFINNLKKNFNGQNVTYTKLPDKITFSDQNKVIPIQVTITSTSNNEGK